MRVGATGLKLVWHESRDDSKKVKLYLICVTCGPLSSEGGMTVRISMESLAHRELPPPRENRSSRASPRVDASLMMITTGNSGDSVTKRSREE